MSDYEITADNIRAIIMHEVYGHGIMGYNMTTTHYKAYEASIESAYWQGSTLRFKQHTVDLLWTR